MVNRPQLHVINRLKEKRIIDFISELTHNEKEVNLSDKNLTSICLDLLMNKFNSMQVNLETLILCNTNITDDSISILSCALSVNIALVILDLSKNSITNLGCIEIKFIIQSNYNLKELYLSWNKFNSEGGCIILDSITTSTNLKILDLSNNSLGNGSAISLKKFISSFDRLMKMETEDGLVHLDLRINQLTKETLTEMSKSIQHNFSIPCIHLSFGHECYMDSVNNLKIYSHEQSVYQPEQIEFLPIYPANFQRPFRKKQVNEFQDIVMTGSDNCWICEGWIEQEFEFFLSSNELNFKEREDKVYIHLEIDGYVACKMIQHQLKQGFFSIVRMIPPLIPLKFYFSFDGLKRIFLSQDIDIVEGNYREVQRVPPFDEKDAKKISETANNKEFFKFENNMLYMNQFNVIRTSTPQHILNEEYRLMISSLPRQDMFLYLNFPKEDSLEDHLLQQQQFQKEKKVANRLQNKLQKSMNH